MKSGKLFGLLLVAAGLIVSLYGLYDLFFSAVITPENGAFVVLGPSLMILGALFRYTSTITRTEDPTPELKKEKLGTWRVRDLEYRLNRLEGEDSEKRTATTRISNWEFEKFKKITNKLFDSLDKKSQEEFKKSTHFSKYQQMFSQDESSEQEKKEFVLLTDNLLAKLPAEAIKKFVKKEKDYGLYQKVVRWAE